MNKSLEAFFSQVDGEVLQIVGPLKLTQPIDKTLPTIYVDGGSRHRIHPEHGISVGDGDSSLENIKLDVLLPKDKDFSDLAFVLNRIPESSSYLIFNGLRGGDLDHELMNLGETYYRFLNQGKMKQLNYDQNLLGRSAGNWNFNINSTFSVFSFEPTEISLDGACEFKAENLKLSPFKSHSLSNKGYGEVKISSTKAFFVYLTKRKRFLDSSS